MMWINGHIFLNDSVLFFFFFFFFSDGALFCVLRNRSAWEVVVRTDC